MNRLRALINAGKQRPLVLLTISLVVGLAVSAAAVGAFVALSQDETCTGANCDAQALSDVAPTQATPTITPSPVEPQTSSQQTDAPVAPAPTPDAAVPGAGASAGPVPQNPGGAAPPAAAPPAAAPNLPPCAGDCGEVRNFCDTWNGGFCADYRNLGAASVEAAFPGPGALMSFDCLDATDPAYEPQMLGGRLPFPCAFSKYEHFMTRMESGSFGLAMMRLQRPFDFAGRTGHIHFEVDLKGRTRNYTRLMISPNLTKRGSDDRSGGSIYPLDFIEFWMRGGVEGTICRGGTCVGDSYPYGDAFGSSHPPYYGMDDVRDTVDVYVSRTHIKVVYNQGRPHQRVMVDEGMGDLGFDRGYVYLAQVSYNPCKDGQCSEAEQIMHWDNVAFDGPTLPVNGLTPSGSLDIVFNAYSASECSVRGVAAQPSGPRDEYTWVTWVARLPADGSAVGPGDVACNYTHATDGSDQVRGFEVVAPR